MSTLSVRLPNSLHNAARELAKQEDVSINQFIALALAEKVSALTTESYLEERARRGSLDHFHRVLDKVPHTDPDPYDQL
jgi:hypothetical protein